MARPAARPGAGRRGAGPPAAPKPAGHSLGRRPARRGLGLGGLGYLWQRYAPIHWGIAYLVPLFGLQALLLVALGSLRGRLYLPVHWSVRRGLGIGLFAHALALHPLTALATGRGLAGAEVIGLTPDPLAMATLGVAAMAEPARHAWPLLVIPALWCLLSALTLFLLDAPGAWLPLLAVAATLAARLWPTRHAPR